MINIFLELQSTDWFSNKSKVLQYNEKNSPKISDKANKPISLSLELHPMGPSILTCLPTN